MTAAGATLRGRAAAEGLMVDACTVTRPGGRGTYDPVTKAYGDGPEATTLYDGKCRLRRPTATDEHPEGADRVVAQGQHLVSLPIAVTGLMLDDVVTVTSSSLDPDLVGLRLRVTAVTKGSHITARRLICEELTP